MSTRFYKFGHFIPDQRITNQLLAERFGITEAWIEERTGIIERRYYTEGATSDMIVAAVNNSGLTQADLEELDCIIIATMTPDHNCPSTAALVQRKLNINHCFAFDIMAACSGFVYALTLADSLLISGKYKNILVAGADKFSTIIDHEDRKTALIFADGAGFCYLKSDGALTQIKDTLCRLDSTLCHSVLIPNGGSAKPLDELSFAEQEHFLRFTDKKVFEGGIVLFEEAITAVLAKNQLTIADIDLIVPHQANKRMIEALAKRMQIPIEKFFINIEYIGNTSAATIPIALSEANEQGKLKGNVLLASVGAGFTYGAGLLEF